MGRLGEYLGRFGRIGAVTRLRNLLLALLLCTCAGSPIPLPGDLRVGIQTDYPPLAFQRDGKMVGVEADLARKVGAALNRRIRFIVLDRSQLIPALEQGRVDVVMAGMSITPERRARVRFVESYAPVGQMAVVRRDQLGRLGGMRRLRASGTRVGFVRGTTGEAYVRGKLGRSIPVPLESVDSGEQAVRQGTVDYFIHDAPTIWRLGVDPADDELFGLYQPLTEEHLAWAVAPDDEELAERLDALVRQWTASGEIQAILTRWAPVRVTQ
jgi:polar amino acid transport system substrate-binding protein